MLSLVAVACFGSVFAQQSKNPFLDMIGEEYGDCFDRYQAFCDSLFSGDSLSRAELIRCFSEAAAADPTGLWELDGQRMQKHIRFYDSRNGGFTSSAEYTSEMFTEDLLDIARQAKDKGFTFVWLVALFNAGDACRIFSNDYERAFKYYLEVASELETISQKDFPWKLYMYREIADFYSLFREYEDAAVFFKKIVEDPDAVHKNNHSIYPALNGLGSCYRYQEMYEQSDSCYLRILELSAPYLEDKYVWEGIAGGNIGYNHYLCGDMDKALEWMIPSLKKMKRPEDDAFTSWLAAGIASIYLQRNDLQHGKKYLDTAIHYHKLSRLPQKGSYLLEVMARYYAVASSHPLMSAYLDSTLQARKREDEAFSGLVLRRVEQKLRAADQEVYKRELNMEKLQSRWYRRATFMVTGTLAVISMLLFFISFYYRRTRIAYRELVRRSQEWAGVESAEADTLCEETEEVANLEIPATDEVINEGKPEVIPEEGDRVIMDSIEKLVVVDGLYKLPDMSLDMLVAHTGLNRVYLSGALNRCTGKNFNTYINEFRVKEAIRLMSETTNENITIEAIGYESGFNDRSTFYRIFKKITGLSPTAFRRNVSRK